jgi:cytidyltransferase-like protein
MIVSLAQAVQAREQARARGRTVAVANGAFDLLHVGHLRYLEDAKRLAGASGVLIVGVNTDASVRAGKGPSRPLVPQDERAELHVKGTDYTAESVPERVLVEQLGGRTVIAGDPKDHSTTDLIARLRERLK